ncbi:phage tail protein [Nocardioides sp. SR21]|uniref:phage tail protein n=1 Tax=Nocardioides sp. SR21 TaxID=2919501 RepID=UPI001FAAEB4C|nr:tail fiber protein [Nocardioides sp. SR21]
MANPYIGEIRIFSGTFAPVGWLLCDGQDLPISQYETLFQLIGTTYGGDGQETFRLPDLRGRVALGQGNGFVLAEFGGAEEVTLTTQQMPSHQHALLASSAPATTGSPEGKVLAASPYTKHYVEGPANTNAALVSTQPVGGSEPHENRQPLLCVNHIISYEGIFPHSATI